MNRSIFICPVCGSTLSRDNRSYTCTKSHCYDISKEGYVNLLLANQKQSREPGDSREMLDARKSFLNKGYYKPLARAVASAVIKHIKHTHTLPSSKKISYCERRASTSYLNAAGFSCKRFDSLGIRTYPVTGLVQDTGQAPVTEPAGTRDIIILDAGCGEGYYTDYISRNRSINKYSSIYGIDISKDGIKSASKHSGTINFAVAGIYNLPVLDNSVDSLLNIFAPFNETEFARVLKNKGIIISVTPGAHHLYEFKKHLYDEVYLNDEKFELSDSFYVKETVRVKYDLNIHNSMDITNLLKMTPYYHKSSPEKIKTFLNTINELKTTADFVIRVIAKTEFKESKDHLV